MTAPAKRVLVALLALTAVACGMLAVRRVAFESWDYWYLSWNLFLAWIPLLFSSVLVSFTRRKPWVSLQGIGLTLLWIGFLPNSFYLVTDLMHLQASTERTLLYDVVLLQLFTITGLVIGFVSTYQVHRLLLDRINEASARRVVAAVFLASSFAIYLGRFLRWNTWDVLANPAGIILDVTDRIINPVAHEQTFWITILLFSLLTTLYFAGWEFYRALISTNKKK